MPDGLTAIDLIANWFVYPNWGISEVIGIYDLYRGTKFGFNRTIDERINEVGRHKCDGNGIAETIIVNGVETNQRTHLREQFKSAYQLAQRETISQHYSYPRLPFPIFYNRILNLSPNDTRPTASIFRGMFGGATAYRYDQATFERVADKFFGKQLLPPKPEGSPRSKYTKADLDKSRIPKAYVGKEKFEYTGILCDQDQRKGPTGRTQAPYRSEVTSTAAQPVPAKPISLNDGAEGVGGRGQSFWREAISNPIPVKFNPQQVRNFQQRLSTSGPLQKAPGNQPGMIIPILAPSPTLGLTPIEIPAAMMILERAALILAGRTL